LEYLFRQALYYSEIRSKMEHSLESYKRGEVPWNRFRSNVMTYLSMDLFCATGHPFYTVAPSLWEALQSTDLTDEFDMLSFNPGLPVIEFILPKKEGLRQDSVFDDIYSLRFIRLTNEDAERHRSSDIKAVLKDGEVYFSVEIFPTDLDSLPLGIAWVVDAEADGAEASIGNWMDNLELLNTPLEEQERIPAPAVRAAVQLAHLLCARKELASKGSTQRPAKRGKKEIRTPRVLGESYGIVRKAASVGHSGTGEGSPKALHIRRGHYRLQPYGEGRLKRKTIWIEPHWAGGNDKQS